MQTITLALAGVAQWLTTDLFNSTPSHIIEKRVVVGGVFQNLCLTLRYIGVLIPGDIKAGTKKSPNWNWEELSHKHVGLGTAW